MIAKIEGAYTAARDRYAEAGVDTDEALGRLAAVPISLHCWQGDDVEGFEKFGTGLGGDWRPRATTRARPERPTTYGPMRRWRWHSFLELIASTCMRPTASSEARSSTATRSARSTLPAGSTGPRRWVSASTSTRPTFRIPKRPTTSRCRTPIRRSARSGSTTASPAGASARRWARRSARPASPTCGFPTA